DRGHFELMVLNIAGNARDALPETGAFRIAAAHDAGLGSLLLTLADDGPGMPDAVRARAFDPFFTTKPSGEGTGLGLSVVRDMVAKAGGGIGIECPAAGGTAVRISLPVAPSAA
ncbi:MAG: sensor histidine kinase, partial [Luteimonas sp.]|nr:sensor histidine kinase [Luteimonas sp.]